MKMEEVNYIDYGNYKKGTIVLLHGWGQNIEMMDMLGRPFEKEYRIICLDLPGFGKSKCPDAALSLDEYTSFLYDFLNKLKAKDIILIGHSFGGRLAINYASKYDTKKLILLSSPFRPTRNIYIKFKIKLYKFLKKIPFLKGLANKMKNKTGSADYKNANDVLRTTLIKSVNTDLTNNAKLIKCPTILIYGKKDIDVKVSEAKALEKLIPDAGLIVYENGTHYAYLEDLGKTISIINSFIN